MNRIHSKELWKQEGGSAGREGSRETPCRGPEAGQGTALRLSIPKQPGLTLGAGQALQPR